METLPKLADSPPDELQLRLGRDWDGSQTGPLRETEGASKSLKVDGAPDRI